MRCSCVPIRVGGDLAGLVKLVAGDETPLRQFAAATRVLSLVVSGVCQESAVSSLSAEVGTLRRCVAELRRAGSNSPAYATDAEPTAGPVAGSHRGNGAGVVDRAVSLLAQRYQVSALSLRSVADALGCNPRYLTSRFTRVVGERMHAYLVRLRVAHACRELLETGAPIKEIAYSSGFRGNASLARAFRRHVGVSPGEYRRIFRDV